MSYGPNCPDCLPAKPCRWYCLVCDTHHPVPTMVLHCLEQATAPQETDCA